ncbi:MAG: hypothetical protein LBU11_00765 [Zoogloeaceae bacterium]|jgi:hypothetical protein|nr:hypothetical protein [Zoogloeaceae bacterium]
MIYYRLSQKEERGCPLGGLNAALYDKYHTRTEQFYKAAIDLGIKGVIFTPLHDPYWTTIHGINYIISAEQMNKYLRKQYGDPSQTLTSESDLDALKKSLKPGQAAIVSSKGHASVLTDSYEDPYVRSYLGDVWVLPQGETCSCK